MSALRFKLKSVRACAASVCWSKTHIPAHTHSRACVGTWKRLPAAPSQYQDSVKTSRVVAHSTSASTCKQIQEESAQMTVPAADLHVQQAWDFWRRIGSPKFHVAPMVDQVCTCMKVMQIEHMAMSVR